MGGGFFLLHKTKDTDWSASQATAIEAFARMGLVNPRLIDGEDYLLAAFPKRQTTELVLEQFANGDFVLACGTLFYGGAVGKTAAIAFYRDYQGRPGPRERAMGHYAVVLRKGGEIDITLDSFGGFHVFCDAGMRIASSSFLVTASILDHVTLSAQGAYEYVFNGVVSGDATLFDEVVLAPVNGTIRVQPRSLEIVRYPIRLPIEVSAEPFEASINRSMEILDGYFEAVASNFGDQVTSALSGGYDSRLILALLRRHGVRPRLYIYGPPGDEEITVARAVAEGEGFHLEIIDKDKEFVADPDEFAAVAHQNFLAADGYGWGGIFSNGAESDQRARRVSGNSIALNGGGGEIWRNFFYLPDRSYSPRQILWSFYSQFDPRTCTAAFDQEVYFRQIEAKLGALIGEPYSSLPRPLVEWLYHNFRCRAWDGRVNSINSTFGHAALPFLERPLTEHASAIPIRWKNHGAYEAELIRRADRRLALYPSSYGPNFVGPPSVFRRLVDYSTYLRPAWLRRFSYRVKHRAGRRSAWQRYLGKPYVDVVLPGGVQAMSALFRLDRAADAQQIARILSLEYAVRQFHGRIRDRFS
jgi:hypothetical protein